MDGLLIAALVHELSDLLPARLERVYQPEPTLFTFRLYAGQEQTLLIDIDGARPRLHLTQHPPANPAAPPAFCMLLRKHLEGMRLVAIQQGPGFDRWLQLVFQRSPAPPGADALAPVGQRRLVVELLDRKPNLILLDEAGRILDAARRGSGEGAGRPIHPGALYQPPLRPGAAAQWEGEPPGVQELAATLAASPPDRPLWRVVRAWMPALGRHLASEAVRHGGEDPDAPAHRWSDHPQRQGILEQVAATAHGWWRQALAGAFAPALVRDGAGEAVAVVPFPVTPPAGGRLEQGRSASELCDRFFQQRRRREAEARRRRQLETVLRQQLARAIRRREAQEADRRRALEAEPYRLYGELLLAFAAQVPRGSSQVELPNYYDPEGKPVTVPVDPSLTPQANAQRYFRLHQKAQRALRQVEERLAATEAEVRYLESVEHALAEAEDLEDLEAIAGELAEQGYLADATAGGGPAGQGKGRTRRDRASRWRGTDGGNQASQIPFLRYRTPGGDLILVGKNNRQNDLLVSRVARPQDIWLHARNVPGSHVLWRRHQDRDDPDESTLLTVARVAAYHSKARWSTRVAVDYTLARHVRKPKGAPPGFVVYEGARTVFVDPDPQRLPPRLTDDGAQEG